MLLFYATTNNLLPRAWKYKHSKFMSKKQLTTTTTELACQNSSEPRTKWKLANYINWVQETIQYSLVRNSRV